MRKTCSTLLLVAFALLVSCRPKDASATVMRDPVLTLLVGPGDTVHAVAGFTVSTGTADSVRVLFTLPGAPNITRTKLAPLTGTRFVLSADLIPSPPYMDGQSGLVTACPTAYRGGNAYVGTCAAPKTYTKPIIPPNVGGDTIIVSLTIIPDSVVAVVGDTIRFTVQSVYKSGRVAIAMGDYWVNREAGWQYPTATLHGRTVGAKVRVLTSLREPASYQPFAHADGSEKPAWPRAPFKQQPCPGASWCGQWL
jgi:hypothetical protein